jgi:hypothetical protein
MARVSKTFHTAFAIGQGAQQHGQIDAGNAFNPAGFEQFEGKVGGRCAKNISQHQNALAVVDQARIKSPLLYQLS